MNSVASSFPESAPLPADRRSPPKPPASPPAATVTNWKPRGFANRLAP
jgi:hypothetical protein